MPLTYSSVSSFPVQTISWTLSSSVRVLISPVFRSSKLHHDFSSCVSNEYCEAEKTARSCAIRLEAARFRQSYTRRIGNGFASSRNSDHFPVLSAQLPLMRCTHSGVRAPTAAAAAMTANQCRAPIANCSISVTVDQRRHDHLCLAQPVPDMSGQAGAEIEDIT